MPKKPKVCGICADYPVPLQEVSSPKCNPILLCADCLREDHQLNLFHQELVRRDQRNNFDDV